MDLRDPVLETEHLRLRRLRPGDLDDIRRILADDLTAHFAGGRERQLAASTRWAEAADDQPCGMLAMERRSDGCFMGCLGFELHEIDGREEVELTWLVDRFFHGQGLATEAARALRDWGIGWGLGRIISLVHPDDTHSVGLAEKIGMRFERGVSLYGHPRVLLFALHF